ncbi:MAG: C1 family peptidase [Candidatus Coatesbacteria bacterium]
MRLPHARSRAYGWLPDLPDARDWVFAARAPRRMPARTDLRAGCSAVEDQGDLGSCTAQALAGALEFLERTHRRAFEERSRLFIYYNERVVLHTVREDSGAMLRDGIKTLAAQGACGEKLWPYAPAKFASRPPAACYRDGSRHQITEYRRIADVDGMRTCLAGGFPFVFGFMVYESFETRAVARTGVVALPGRREKALGGHAVMAVGYDDAAKRFLVRNSWGTKWGMRGYFTMPYAYLASRDLSDDFWVIRAGEGL